MPSSAPRLRPILLTSLAGFASAALLLGACSPQTPAVTPLMAPDPAELCSGANAVGVGLLGTYFAEPGLHGAVVATRTDASIDLTELDDLPEALRGNRGSVRWSGWVKGPTTGAYRFHVEPIGAQVTIARNDVKADGPLSVPVQMVAGQFYPITVELESLSASKLPVKLEWTAPHGARYIIPRQLLNTPSDQVQVRVEPLKAPERPGF